MLKQQLFHAFPLLVFSFFGCMFSSLLETANSYPPFAIIEYSRYIVDMVIGSLEGFPNTKCSLHSLW